MYNPRQLLVGALVGILVPALIMVLIYAYKFSQKDFFAFLEQAIEKGVIAPIIALSLIGNLGLFFLFTSTNRLWAARGVMIATIIYGLLMLYFKFLS